MNTHTRRVNRVNRVATRVIIALVMVFGLLVGLVLSSSAQSPFAGTTNHKTVKNMSKRQVKNAKKGKTFYYRKNRRVVKRIF